MRKRGKGRLPKPYNAEFCKVFLPRHLTSQEFLIPPDFVKHFNRTLQERIILKDVGGKIWHVGVERTRSGVFIKSGWQSFVNYHRPKVGEFLVFKYDGNYSFLVKIFSTNGCKKVILPAEKIAPNVKTEEENEVDQITVEHACVTKEDHSSRGSVRTEEDSKDVEENRLKKQNVNTELPENCKNIEKADSVLPECAYFVSTPSRSTPYYMNIPNEVINREDVHFEPEMVLRNANGKEWPARVYKVMDGRMYIGRGWTAFRKNNNIRFGDRCMFKFDTERISNIIEVQVLRHKSDVSQIRSGDAKYIHRQ